QVDVLPYPPFEAAARVDELEREVVGAASGAEPPLARHRVDPFDDPVLGQLGDRAHDRSLRPPTAVLAASPRNPATPSLGGGVKPLSPAGDGSDSGRASLCRF